MAQYLSLPRLEGPISLTLNEIATIKARISEAQEQLNTLENPMNKDGAVNLDSTSLKDRKNAEIASLQNILSPIRRMPPEIVSEIFMIYCSMYHRNYGGLHQATRTRIILTSVCAAWRNAAVATPELWSELKVYREGYRRTNPADSDIVTQWLSRSGDLPLHLNISLRMGYMGNISEAFLAFSHRIHSLEVCLPMKHFEPFLHLPKSSFPSLEKLILDFRHRDPFYFSEELESQYPSGIEIFSDSHQLKYVKFDEDGFSSVLENIKLPQDTVTSLMVSATYCYRSQFPSVYFDTVRSMNQLVHCTIDFPAQRFELSDTRQPIILPFLQSLTLSTGWDVDTGYDAAFFRCLYAPLLKDLHLVHESLNHMELVKELKRFHARSAVSLSSLHLSSFYGDAISGKDIIPLVAVFPSIHTLRVDQTSTRLDIRPLLVALVYNPNHPGPLHLPNLEELNLDVPEVEVGEVCNLIQSYWRPIDKDNAGANPSLPDVEDGTSRLRKAKFLASDRQVDVDRLTKLAHESALHGIQFEFE
ncbi:hypothetical protein BDP27DRAFT_1267445 [Rhodocollybia butyracea]|uniref:F-box domain-containing protein n=1 Tax=Rhodocollybia butyracea TaxID=206335 RepID=A0A9P5PQD9_9AGAR|nr:hypothetical protein BDP27DRAFT_1267445 [Rhodocollybia butyracea]